LNQVYGEGEKQEKQGTPLTEAPPWAIGSSGMPLRRTWGDEGHNKGGSKFQKHIGKSIFMITSNKYSQRTESKYFLMSSLKRREGGRVCPVNRPRVLAHIHENFVDTTSLHECALSF
jgi:hypothetical protein